jgi:general secretion pathway protein D
LENSLRPHLKPALSAAGFASLVFLAACSTIQPPAVSTNHLHAENIPSAAVSRDIPTPVAAAITLPRPTASAKTETYSVSVRNIPVQDLLFALSRDAKINVDVHPGINGIVTINAIDQTLQQILTRIAKQVDMRWELDGPNLIVMPDSPFLHTYKVDYVNMLRDVSSSVSINTQIASTSSGASTSTATGGGNNSTTTVTSKAQNNFWASVEKNIKDILRETDKILPEGSSETVIEHDNQQETTGTGASSTGSGKGGKGNTPSLAGSPNPASLQEQGTTVVKRTTFREAASVIANPEAGVIVVRATSRQHEKVQEYIDQVTRNAGRQVIIEATIAEVTLNNNYKQGINWQSLRSLRSPGTAGFSLAQSPTGLTNGAVPDPFATPGASFLLNYVAPGLGISSTLTLLETFGNVKVLSSPKISVLNNQTAMLKVVDNVVYFEVKSDSTIGQVNTQKSFTTTAKSIAVGLVMNVTPQISEANMITLNVRPTISRVTGFKTDPNPDIPSTIPNRVPEIQTREMESVLRLADGEIAVMGGLMEDKINYNTDAVPGLGGLPGIGNFFRNRDDTNTKTELVIFLKPTIIRDASLNGDYREFRQQLPKQDFFFNNPGPDQKMIESPRTRTP